jgi:hypothetical protein
VTDDDQKLHPSQCNNMYIMTNQKWTQYLVAEACPTKYELKFVYVQIYHIFSGRGCEVGISKRS